MKRFRFLLLLAVLAPAFLVSCDDDDNDMEPMATTVVDIATSSDDFSILVEALQAAGLVDALTNPSAEFTVFAPTNDAFADLLADLGVTKAELLADPDLADILLFHVVSGTVLSTDLSTGYVKTLNTAGPGGTSPDLRVVVGSGVTLNGGSTVETANLTADNGVVHVIDKVMLPPTIVDLALSNDAFTSLVAALTAGDNTTDYVAALSGAGPFTVFAPTNDAFQALLDSEPTWDELTDIPVGVRDAVLKYHVSSAGNVESGDLTDGQTIPTLQGSNLTVDLTSGAQLNTTSGQTVDIIITDVQGTNGIIHVVDAVLLPAS